MADNAAPQTDGYHTTVGKADTNHTTKEDTSPRDSSSISSTPEADVEPCPPEQHPTQKRKGGRKPIYATSEERKQRNRAAQAAFRERRTEYIKQLETTIKHHEEALQTLQQSHRSAADECLMLRYKNSLLERILLEKGIDVQAELQAKTGSPNLGPTRPPLPPTTTNSTPITRPIQRYALNRLSQSRLSAPGGLQNAQANHNLPMQPDSAIQRSPHSQPTPTSHLSSPSILTSKSPNFLPQSGMTSPAFGPTGQQQQPHLRPQPQQQQQPRTQFTPVLAPTQRPALTPNYAASTVSNVSPALSGVDSTMSGNTVSPNYYRPQFQSHMDQLEQEYDAQADMIDEDPNDPQSAGPFPNQSFQQSIQQQQTMQSPNTINNPNSGSQHNFMHPGLQQAETNNNFLTGLNPAVDPYDPSLDADPFGLSASMHFPTQFSFESR